MDKKVERWVWTAEGMVPYRAHPLNVGGYFVNGYDYDALAEREQEKIHALIEDFNTVQVENSRLRAALEAINEAWNTKPHHRDGINTFHVWYAAHIEMIEAALTETSNPTLKEE